MPTNITYGFGGFCADCDETHDHPLHNIIEEVVVDEPTPES